VIPRRIQLPSLPSDRYGRLGLAAACGVLWWTLALADLRVLLWLPLVVLGVRAAHKYRPLPPERDDFEDWF
jgi:hypothetical protein